jgi:hypothetical protein
MEENNRVLSRLPDGFFRLAQSTSVKMLQPDSDLCLLPQDGNKVVQGLLQR